ncbi:MAG: ComF family protein [Chloroflexi bacterium]|nr:ComF family protein [Chloroflexota bacterium]
MLNLALPERCVVCGREGRYICHACEIELPAMGRPYCVVCAAPEVPQLCDSCYRRAPAFDSVRAPFEFRGPARQIVHDLKYRGVRIAAPYVARLLADYLRRNPYPADAYCPVPLHPRRERNRGFNQSALIARELSALTGVAVDADALRRSRHTPPQVSMDTAGARQRNIADAFECAISANGKRYILIDDVVTTGSTMSACAAALKDAGATHVWGIGFARQGAFGDEDDDGDGVSGVWV